MRSLALPIETRAPRRGSASAPALRLSHPSDASEKQADTIAQRVMSPQSHAAPARQCACGGTCPTCAAKASNVDVRRAAQAGGERTVAAMKRGGVERVLSATGRPLDGSVRRFMESRFGEHFGDVRIHDDREAHGASRALGARAFTVGDDIAFARGRYQPATEAGRRLIAHELTHVVQQRGMVSAQRSGLIQREPDGAAEQALREVPKECPPTIYSLSIRAGVRHVARREGYRQDEVHSWFKRVTCSGAPGKETCRVEFETGGIPIVVELRHTFEKQHFVARTVDPPSSLQCAVKWYCHDDRLSFRDELCVSTNLSQPSPQPDGADVTT